MSVIISGATCSDKFDFVFTDDGYISIETSTASALANMLKLDFTSNDDWELDPSLGVHWLSKDNDGLLQVRGSEAQIVGAVQRKLMSIDGIKQIKEIEVSRGLNRKLYISVVVIADTGEEIKLEKEV
ncbi:MAG: hypothetical protein ACRCX7_11115 [Cetobacterium sp.]|uniref:hypothetical protein n=1 Tax=Cetobacterium sp. TaxID=2071632 RepID=UPI003F36572F